MVIVVLVGWYWEKEWVRLYGSSARPRCLDIDIVVLLQRGSVSRGDSLYIDRIGHRLEGNAISEPYYLHSGRIGVDQLALLT